MNINNDNELKKKHNNGEVPMRYPTFMSGHDTFELAEACVSSKRCKGTIGCIDAKTKVQIADQKLFTDQKLYPVTMMIANVSWLTNFKEENEYIFIGDLNWNLALLPERP